MLLLEREAVTEYIDKSLGRIVVEDGHETDVSITQEELRQEIARDRTEQFFNFVNDTINQRNAPIRSGLPYKYGYEGLARGWKSEPKPLA